MGRLSCDRCSGLQTMLAHVGDDAARFCGSVIPPIFQNSLFTYPTYEALEEAFTDEKEHYIYTRGLNPTVEVAEKKIAALEGGEMAKCFASGMAAISAAVFACVEKGSHIICVDSVYPVAYRWLSTYLPRFGVETTFVTGDSLQEFEDAIRPNTRLIYLESPSSLVFKVQDIAAVAGLARQHGIKTMIDNTWATPVFQKPLSMGVDIVVHSASKYLSGQSSLVAGVLVGSAEIVRGISNREQAMLGAILGPFEAWLLTAGLRTLAVRMERHQSNAMEVARFLECHGKVKSVAYPGLPSSPYHELARRQMSGFSGVFSFTLDMGKEAVKRFVNALKYFGIGISWGGFESLVYPLAVAASSGVPDATRRQQLDYESAIRVTVGLEDVEDLLEDLDAALRTV